VSFLTPSFERKAARPRTCGARRFLAWVAGMSAVGAVQAEKNSASLSFGEGWLQKKTRQIADLARNEAQKSLPEGRLIFDREHDRQHASRLIRVTRIFRSVPAILIVIDPMEREAQNRALS
jgi:predicted kinase